MHLKWYVRHAIICWKKAPKLLLLVHMICLVRFGTIGVIFPNESSGQNSSVERAERFPPGKIVSFHMPQWRDLRQRGQSGGELSVNQQLTKRMLRLRSHQG